MVVKILFYCATCQALFYEMSHKSICNDAKEAIIKSFVTTDVEISTADFKTCLVTTLHTVKKELFNSGSTSRQGSSEVCRENLLDNKFLFLKQRDEY